MANLPPEAVQVLRLVRAVLRYPLRLAAVETNTRSCELSPRKATQGSTYLHALNTLKVEPTFESTHFTSSQNSCIGSAISSS